MIKRSGAFPPTLDNLMKENVDLNISFEPDYGEIAENIFHGLPFDLTRGGLSKSPGKTIEDSINFCKKNVLPLLSIALAVMV